LEKALNAAKLKAKKGLKYPSLGQTVKRCIREGWDKHNNEAELLASEHELFRRELETMGVDRQWIAKKLLELFETDKSQALQRFMDLTGVKAPNKVARTDNDGEETIDTIFVLPEHAFGEYSRSHKED